MWWNFGVSKVGINSEDDINVFYEEGLIFAPIPRLLRSTRI